MFHQKETQYPAESLVLKTDWKKLQGPPAEHFARAKAHGYDFYTVTDHSQEADFQPPRPTNPNWLATKKAAADASDDRFVALTGFEHSENNGPGGRGHLNVLNTAEYINAASRGLICRTCISGSRAPKPNGEDQWLRPSIIRRQSVRRLGPPRSKDHGHHPDTGGHQLEQQDSL